MATIILAWEDGKGLSHLSRLLEIGTRLFAQGHCIYVIVRDVTYLQWFKHDFKVLASPVYQHSPANTLRKHRIGGYADYLTLLGFNSVKNLSQLINAWDQLFHLIKPDLLICDNAPLASLAAFNTLPCLQVSNGFNLPPLNLPTLPRLRPDVPPLAREEVLLENILRVQIPRKRPPLRQLADITNGHTRFVCHLPELDPYYLSRQSEHTGPLLPLPFASNSSNSQHFFAYLSASYPGLDDLLVKIAESPGQGSFFIPNASSMLKKFLKQSGKNVYENLPSISEITTTHNLIIHHGGLTLAQLALHAGLPQILLPLSLETDIISYRLKEQQVGFRIDNSQQPYEIADQILATMQGLHLLQEWSTFKSQEIQQRNCFPLMDSIIAASNEILN